MLVWVDPPDESSDETAFSDVVSRAKAVLAHSIKALRKESKMAGRSFNEEVFTFRQGATLHSITSKIYVFQIEK